MPAHTHNGVALMPFGKLYLHNRRTTNLVFKSQKHLKNFKISPSNICFSALLPFVWHHRICILLSKRRHRPKKKEEEEDETNKKRQQKRRLLRDNGMAAKAFVCTIFCSSLFRHSPVSTLSLPFFLLTFSFPLGAGARARARHHQMRPPQQYIS